jgi:YVTN family beta-propeller protein
MRLSLVVTALLLAGFAPVAAQQRSDPSLHRLPTGVSLDPVGSAVTLGSLPLALTLSPDGRYAVALLNGWREQGFQVVDRRTGAVVQTVPQAAAFLGLAFSPDGRTLYVSGGDRDVVYRYDWAGGRAALRDSLDVTPGEPARRHGVRYPSGLAPSPDGRYLYVAENLGDSLSVFDVASGRLVRRYPTGRYPYGVAVTPDGSVYVSAWDGYTVSVFRPDGTGVAAPAGSIQVGRHPSALALSPDGSRLFVASGSTDRITVVDTRHGHVVAELPDAAPSGPSEGSTPDALAVSADAHRLYVAEADNNAVAVFDLTPSTGGYGDGTVEADRLAGRIPVGWYPTALAVSGDSLLVVNGKGLGSAPNPGFPQPGHKGDRSSNYTLGQLSGTLSVIPISETRGAALARHTADVARFDNWDRPRTTPRYPPFEHVIYVIKENRTYDQVLGDLKGGDGDTSLVFFPRPVTPNYHALAERFGIYDRFFVNAEVSADGHDWTTAAYAPDYVEKTAPSNYGSQGRTYDFDGTNRDRIPGDEGYDDVDAPANGYLWDLAERAGITFRNYGEFVVPDGEGHDDDLPPGFRGTKPYLDAHTDHRYPGFDLDILDQARMKEWLREFKEFEARGTMPALEIMVLPSDHTSGGAAGAWTPTSYAASNDLALGHLVEAVSKSRFWKNTVIFVLEDDAQDGPDHVDSHRSPFLAISPYSRGGVRHRFTNTTDVVATITEILHLGSLSQYDHFGRPLRDIWTSTPDLSPYHALTPSVSLDARNPRRGPEAVASRGLDLRFEDVANEELFNHILWRMMKGPHRPYPGSTRMSALEWKRGR